ncbi:Mobile element protein [Methanosarcina siciliae C2J]|uniref:Mobile element protein n=1 Tax=Methanosarcina siciliae C2J TaxID=1434118 RepID=A0A0E3PK27_9EURY|nr:hypothetical protein [Methanosarcina siciliae]AKB34715.1 Mobile element protein [Methanosarcina siciliae C2J]
MSPRPPSTLKDSLAKDPGRKPGKYESQALDPHVNRERFREEWFE